MRNLRAYWKVALFMAAVVIAVAATQDRLAFPLPAGFRNDPAQARAHGEEVFARDASVVLTFKHDALLPLDDVDGLMRAATADGLVAHAHDYVVLRGVRALRLQLDYRGDGRDYRRVDYLVPLGQQLGILSFTVDRAASDGELARFDAIARTTPGLPPPERTTAWLVGQLLYVGAVALVLLAYLGWRRRAVRRRGAT